VLAPATRFVDARANVPFEIDQPVEAGSTDQLMSVPVGRTSLTVTPVAVAEAAVFDTVIVNPIGLPAETVALSAVFVIVIVGHCTVVDADACGCPLPFVSEAVAVLLKVVHDPPVVPLTM